MEREHILSTTELNFDDLDKCIIDAAVNSGYGQTDYQLVNFVSQSHPTLYRQLRQTFLEIEVREHSLSKISISKRKAEVLLRQKENLLSATKDLYERELVELEIEDLKIDIQVYDKKLKMAQEELKIFLNFVRRYCSTEEDIKKALEPNSEEEHKYWIARMAKQSAVDVLTQGRIGPGNLDSILMMSEEDQVATMQLALDYSSALGVGLHNLRLSAEEKTKAILEDREIPAQKFLESVVNGYEQKELLQSTYQPETKS
jgi:hypothetical protein